MVINMPASYPNSVKTWADKQDNIDDVFAGDVNGAYAEIIAVETELMQVGYKRSVRVATTQNGALATAFANGQSIDGIVLATGDRILIKDQTNGAENGIYTVNASGAPTRATDANTDAHMVAGLMVYVREGTVNAKGTWKLTTTETVTLGTTSLVFENEVAAHKADLVTDIDGVHGLKIEEGTWTPEFIGSSNVGDVTYTTNVGRYTKIGKLVNVMCSIKVNTKGTLIAGELYVRNLPFTPKTSGPISISRYVNFNVPSEFPVLGGVALANYNIIIFFTSGTNQTNINGATINILNNGSILEVSCVYEIN
jgi:hypothetical protein